MSAKLTETENNSIQHLTDAQLEAAAEKFYHILEMRGDLNLKVARRVTFLTRFVMIFVGGLTMALFFLLLTISTKIDPFTEAIKSMNTNFTIMVEDMSVMRQVVSQMDGHVNAMPSIKRDMTNMNQSMQGINQRMGIMNQQVAGMEGKVGLMNQQVSSMDQSVYQLNQGVGGIDGSFNRMEGNLKQMKSDIDVLSRPVNMMNKFNPFK